MTQLLFLTYFIFTPLLEVKTPVSVEIQVRKKDGTMETVYISDKPEVVSKLKSCLKGKSAPNFKCGYTGKIIFIESNGKKWNAEFNLTSCNHIVYMKGGRLISKYLKDEAINLLKELTKT